MTKNMTDIDHSPPVLDGGDQPALIVAYVEHHKPAHYIRPSPTVPNIRKIRPIRIAGYLVPRVQGRAPFIMSRGRLTNRLAAHDSHLRIFAFCEVLVNLGSPALGESDG
jgi:hypothetical protein